MNKKMGYILLNFLAQREVLNWFQFTVTVFPRMNDLGTYFKILERETYLKGFLIEEDGYFTTDRKGNDKKDCEAILCYDC